LARLNKSLIQGRAFFVEEMIKYKNIMRKRLTRQFYTKSTLKVAKELLGKYIVRKIGKKKLEGMIIETEAYIGPQDKASHAYKGKVTPRNKAEYLIGGHIYIYLVYGMYWQLNISTSKEGKPECVLIRAIEPAIPRFKFKNQNAKCKITIQNSKLLKKMSDGPGKLCRWLKLDGSFYGEDLTKSKRIWLEDRGIKIKPSQIIATKRVGIDYAGPYWANKKWRFLLKDVKVEKGR
jgi:DNA-3-methyladenine glycosylase